MDNELANRDTILRYLLGSAKAEEQEQVENSFVNDEEFFDFILIEDQLICDYLNDKLSPSERALFEQNYLKASARRRERVAIAQALIEQAKEWKPEIEPEQAPLGQETIPPTVSWREHARKFLRQSQLAFRALALVAVLSLGVIWLLLQLRSQRRLSAHLEEQRLEEQRKFQQQLQQKDEELFRQSQELQQQSKTQEELRVENESLQQDRDELTRVVEAYKQELRRRQAEKSSAEQQIARLLPPDEILERAITRGGPESPEHVIEKKGTVTLYLKLQEKPQYESYNAELGMAGASAPIRPFPVLKPHKTPYGQAIILTISTEKLKPGSYVIDLFGRNRQQDAEPVGSYRFRIK